MTGSLRLHAELEGDLATFLGQPQTLVLSTGYAANLAVVTALADRDSLIVSDAHVHASLVDAVRLSRADVVIVPHNDVAAVFRSTAEGETGRLVVGEQARIEGEIRVSHLVVNGTLVGPVHASDFLELQPRSRVSGDVHYTSLEMHLGAVVDGRLVHEGSVAERKPVELKLATTN